MITKLKLGNHYGDIILKEDGGEYFIGIDCQINRSEFATISENTYLELLEMEDKEKPINEQEF